MNHGVVEREHFQRNRLIRLVTLGCKVNQYETQLVKEALRSSGYHEAEPGEPAGLCVVNTCTVTAEGDAKSRQAVRRLHQENPGAPILVMGCYATRDPQTVARLPGVARVVTDKARLGEVLGEFGVTELPRHISRFDGHRRAFVKVQDGCLLNCSYCIIPKVRPVARSREPDEIVEEVSQLVANGYREIVLTGVHLGHYGIDLSKGRPKAQWRRLWHLLERLAKLPGDFRLRLSSLEAAEVRDDLVRALADHPRVVPHLHLCLQSGSDRILARMKRRYRTAGFLARCEKLRAALDLPAFTTDVIVGFPGETDADFEATCRVAREVGFAKIHIFSYSPRIGTAAADFTDHVPAPVVTARRARLRDIEKDLASKFLRKLLGRQLEVLVEDQPAPWPGHVLGTSCRYAPAAFIGDQVALLGKLVPVLARRIEDGIIVGHPAQQARSLPAPVLPRNGSRISLRIIAVDA
jgi:threonylcarbamoyladenosine tRNA methylthiotransferase MtaB